VSLTGTHTDETEVQGEVSSTTIPFDYLIYAVGAETQTFGIPGVKEHACFMKEIQDAEKVSYHFEVRWRGLNCVPQFKRRFMDCTLCDKANFLPRSHHCIRRRVGWLPWSKRGGD